MPGARGLTAIRLDSGFELAGSKGHASSGFSLPGRSGPERRDERGWRPPPDSALRSDAGRRQLKLSARLLSVGGPKLWAEFMDELRENHLGVKRRKRTGPSVGERLQAAYESVVRAR